MPMQFLPSLRAIPASLTPIAVIIIPLVSYARLHVSVWRTRFIISTVFKTEDLLQSIAGITWHEMTSALI